MGSIKGKATGLPHFFALSLCSDSRMSLYSLVSVPAFSIETLTPFRRSQAKLLQTVRFSGIDSWTLFGHRVCEILRIYVNEIEFRA